MRCAIYIRVSTDGQTVTEHGSLRHQEEVCRRFVNFHAENDGPAAVVYADVGCSNVGLQRPRISELLQDVRAHKVDAVAVSSPDRVSRSLGDFREFSEFLKANGVQFISVTQHLDL